ncbi:HIV Tat-specific factor 1 homolog [Belonocnema kinseyi]|uniref:HIV Tat-specific factor 1 homolog n=1 Tax=Belonocnema kinseyi TaxID=2817044 RepID=UPI00143D9BC2|nr:HIV Tat-specific factor 1 homolog [Belonocnema kinseyi]
MEINNKTGSEKIQVKSQEMSESDCDSGVKQEIEGREKSLRVSHTVPGIKQKIIPEKPKVQSVQNKEEQIEEFDSDEEEELEKSKNENTVPNDYSKHLTYEGDICIYTEPGTGRKLVWNAEENAWRDRDTPSGETVAAETDPTKEYEHDGKNYVYTDKTTNLTYKFDQEKNEWIVKDKDEVVQGEEKSAESGKREGPTTTTPNAIYAFENDTHTYTDPSDGSVYMWDRKKHAWFPKVDDDFMARYQMSYGFTDPNAVEKNPKPAALVIPTKIDKEQKRLEAKRKNLEPPTWFEIDDKNNTAIYVQGLPPDITMEELTELFNKCGLLARDEKGKDKIKLYRDKFGELKGDALCTYIKIESVDLALNILDGWKIRGKTLSVQRAKFQLKGEYDPAKKPKKRKKDKERQKKFQEKLFDWRPDRLPGEPQKHERVVIIKNLFKPEDFDKEVSLLLEYQTDVRSECAKCGEVKRVLICDRHPDGVAQVTFKESEAAQACVQLLNGRWFGQRKITAEIWDGKTKYKVAETEAEIEARIDKWDKYLEDVEDTKEEEQKAAVKKETEEREQARSSGKKSDGESMGEESEKSKMEKTRSCRT